MNSQIKKLYQIAGKKERLIIGLMSGTSLDGLDVALCRFYASGLETKMELLKFKTVPYEAAFKTEIKSVFAKPTGSLEKVCLLHPWIGLRHANIVVQLLEDWKIKSTVIDLIASHGQTIYHAPQKQHGDSNFGNATFQIGDADHIAQATGIITIGDFRQKNIAAGGEGAPLAAYGDFLLFSKPGENRIMLNIGGIANFTFLPGNLQAETLFTTDVGPGNILMDAFLQKEKPGVFYDQDALVAKRGICNCSLLKTLKENEFFSQPFPKTTGPEIFNLMYLEQAKQMSQTTQIGLEDTLATLNRFSAEIIVEALKKCSTQPLTIYSSGGGIHNPLLMETIKKQIPQATFFTTAELGIPPDAKEAILFATLANECVSGGCVQYGAGKTILPSVTMGKISIPN